MINKQQEEIHLITRFLHGTTEPFDDWDWDGKTLIIYLTNEIIEVYKKSDIKFVLQSKKT